MALFSPDARFVVYMDPRSGEPTMDLHSRADLAPVFDNLNVYQATTHFNGQSTVILSRGIEPRGRPTAWPITCRWTASHGR